MAHWRRPDGRGPDPYPGWERWSKNRWAWEFLRRNKDFQKACDKPADKDQVADAFGLLTFKDYRHEYRVKPVPRFMTSVVSYPKRAQFKQWMQPQPEGAAVTIIAARQLTVRVAANAVLFKVPLTLLTSAHKKALARIKKDIESRLDDFAKLLPKELIEAKAKRKTGKGMGFQVRTPGELHKMLLYLDRCARKRYQSDQAAWEDIAANQIDNRQVSTVSDASLAGKGAKLRRNATQMVERDYLALALVGLKP